VHLSKFRIVHRGTDFARACSATGPAPNRPSAPTVAPEPEPEPVLADVHEPTETDTGTSEPDAHDAGASTAPLDLSLIAELLKIGEYTKILATDLNSKPVAELNLLQTYLTKYFFEIPDVSRCTTDPSEPVTGDTDVHLTPPPPPPPPSPPPPPPPSWLRDCVRRMDPRRPRLRWRRQRVGRTMLSWTSCANSRTSSGPTSLTQQALNPSLTAPLSTTLPSQHPARILPLWPPMLARLP
jgi:hypothetical protein